jgi:flagellar protein FlaG
MDITAIGRAAPSAYAPTPVPPVDRTATRDIVQAVKAVNGAEMFGPENELVFQKDLQTQRMVVKLVNRQTGDVVNQVPVDYVLRLAEDRRLG